MFRSWRTFRLILPIRARATRATNAIGGPIPLGWERQLPRKDMDEQLLTISYVSLVQLGGMQLITLITMAHRAQSRTAIIGNRLLMRARLAPDTGAQCWTLVPR